MTDLSLLLWTLLVCLLGFAGLAVGHPVPRLASGM